MGARVGMGPWKEQALSCCLLICQKDSERQLKSPEHEAHRTEPGGLELQVLVPAQPGILRGTCSSLGSLPQLCLEKVKWSFIFELLGSLILYLGQWLAN